MYRERGRYIYIYTYSAGRKFVAIYSTSRCGSKNNYVASCKTGVFLASANLFVMHYTASFGAPFFGACGLRRR